MAPQGGGAPLISTDGCARDLEVNNHVNNHRSSFMRQLSEGSAGAYDSMEWTKLSFKIKDKVILDDLSGYIAPGDMCCILGPSGAGKSTLLNILAGRMNTKGPNISFTGEVSVCGCLVDPVKVRSNIAYVMQEDALLAMSTPRELLEMSAVLRLGSSRARAAEQVSELLAALRLDSCADTYVGSALVRGISGGEKKRTAVAAELITKPKMIFLDEPLSGLDSYAAWTVIQVLRDLCEHGCTVLCTVHQPSSEIFQLFNKMICLANGRTVYCGEVNTLCDYMNEVGHPVPNLYNPADHILFFVQTQTDQDLAGFSEKWRVEEEKAVLPSIASKRGPAEALEQPRIVKRKPFLTQLFFLVRREFREVIRNKIGLVMRFAVNGIMNIVFACIFQGIGSKNDSLSGLRSHFGAVCNIMIGTMFGSAQPLLLQFPSERAVFLREYAANMYGSAPYFLAKTVIELPMSFLTSVESWVLAYWIMDLQGNWILLVLVSWMLSLTATSTALLIGCSVASAQAAQELSPLIFVPQIIFSGIFITINLIPVWMRWLQYACALKYAINLGCIVEFAGVEGGKEFLEAMDIREDMKWVYVGILAGIFVVFRGLAMLQLRRKAKYVY